MHCHSWLSAPYYSMINTQWSTKNQTHGFVPQPDFSRHPSQRAFGLHCEDVMRQLQGWTTFFFMFKKGVTYCLREQLSWGRKAEPSTDSFTEKEACLGSENKALSWVSDSKLRVWLWPWAGHLTCRENREIKVKNLQVNNNVENALSVLLFYALSIILLHENANRHCIWMKLILWEHWPTQNI